MSKNPKKKGSVYTAQIGLRIEPELKERLNRLRDTTDNDIGEAIRIRLRDLALELEQETLTAS